MNNVLACEQLTRVFVDGKHKITIFEDLDFAVQSKETVAIMGASGAGKSTLLHLLGGLDQPTSGRVWVNGQDVLALSERDRCQLRNQSLGFIYQFHHLLPEFTALENVCMPLLIAGQSRKKAIEKASQLIEAVGLTERASHRTGELSGGERQRIAIARALVNDPVCVLADEPTGNLDQGTANQVFDLMLSLNKSLGISFVVVTHNEQLANRLGRVLRLEHKILR